MLYGSNFFIIFFFFRTQTAYNIIIKIQFHLRTQQNRINLALIFKTHFIDRLKMAFLIITL